jgi:hypothetical protein
VKPGTDSNAPSTRQNAALKVHYYQYHRKVETSQGLVYTKGYEQMTIQDILDDLQISKGAFYHYFGSKKEWFVSPRDNA